MTYQTLHSSLSSVLLEMSSMLMNQTLDGRGRRLIDTRADVAADRGAIKKKMGLLVQRVERHGEKGRCGCD